jgi:hypothetical protein
MRIWVSFGKFSTLHRRFVDWTSRDEIGSIRPDRRVDSIGDGARQRVNRRMRSTGVSSAQRNTSRLGNPSTSQCLAREVETSVAQMFQEFRNGMTLALMLRNVA